VARAPDGDSWESTKSDRREGKHVKKNQKPERDLIVLGMRKPYALVIVEEKFDRRLPAVALPHRI
jgi:hypothetical protein